MIAAPQAQETKAAEKVSETFSEEAGASTPTTPGQVLSWALALASAGAVVVYLALNWVAVARPLAEILEVLRS